MGESRGLREFGLKLIELAEVLEKIGDESGAEAFAEAAFLAAITADHLEGRALEPVPLGLRLRWAARKLQVDAISVREN